MSIKSNLMALGGRAEDFWDDDELIKAYDDAVKFKEILVANGITNDIQIEESKPPGPWEEVTEVVTREYDPSILDTGNENPLNSTSAKKPKKWKVGSKCRAIYSEDGLEYEATITEITQDGSCAVVRFIGYENEEEVDTLDLVKSHGNKHRERQELTAANLASQEANNTLSDSEQMSYLSTGVNNLHLNPPSSSTAEHQFQGCEATLFENSKYSAECKLPNQSRTRAALLTNTQSSYTMTSETRKFEATPNGNSPFPKMLMPPFPNSLVNEAEGPVSGKGDLPSLLRAWYMSGYHSGYFDAKQDLKRSTRAKKRQQGS